MSSYLRGIVTIGVLGLIESSRCLGATLTYDYVGGPLIYESTGLPFPVPQYGPEMIGVLTVDSALVPPNFSGTLSSESFSFRIGGTDIGLYSGCVQQQFQDICTYASDTITFQGGRIVSWNLGADYEPNGNTTDLVSMISDTSGDGFHPFSIDTPYVEATSSTPGIWTLQVAPVPAPGTLPLFISGIGLLLTPRCRRSLRRGRRYMSSRRK